MAKCEYGTENCIFAGQEHDEECCFDGFYYHTYICQECGFKWKSVKKQPNFPPKNCDKCKTQRSMT